jgi:hypothetical protein
MTSGAFVLRQLTSTGRVFGEAIASIGPAQAKSLRRFSYAWRRVLRGRDTPLTRMVLEQEGQRLKAAVELLPESERYEAAMAIHMRVTTVFVQDIDSLLAVAKATSTLLDPAREKLVAHVVNGIHLEVADLFKRAGAGEKLSAIDNVVVKDFATLKALTGSRFDDVLLEIVRESVRQLKSSAGAPVASVSSRLNSIQGAVAQAGFFSSAEFRSWLATGLVAVRRQMRGLRRTWTATVVTEGRIYLARRIPTGGYVLEEFVDGAIVTHEKTAASGRLAKGFLSRSAQVKAELRVSALPQNLRDELRRTPGWGSEAAVMFIPSGSGYKVLELVAPPVGLEPERMLIAAAGGVWPANLSVPPSVARTITAQGPLTRDACRSIGSFVLRKARALLE